MSELTEFWPSAEALRSVVASQAEGLTQKAFLAVHQPMTFRREDYGSVDLTNKSETDLLEFLLRESGDGCVISVVLGRSGVGKSHAIRWLYETIHARADSDRYVLVWVPRTRSAKGVLRDLLDLPGFEGKEWDDLRSSVGAATDGLSVARAARLIQAEMVLGLQSPPATDLPAAVREFVDQAGRELANFIQDPNVWLIPPDADLETTGVAAGKLSPWIRLAQNVVTGDVDPEDEGARRFLDSDLEFPVELGDRVGAQAREFWELLQVSGGILQGGTSLRQGALEVLNNLLDDAKAAVLGVNQTPISDLFTQLRERLCNEDKELVLLIEDMTVMSGLQRSLLDVMVQPAGALAGRQLCTIRTALALTPGFMQGGALPDNVMTRAVAEWWVEEDMDEKKILSQYEGLAAGYLNAARHVLAGSDPSPDIFDVQDGDDDAELVETINAFGRHRGSSRPFFPFNRAAIEVLARGRVQDEGRLIYNPRRFLNLVLLGLLQGRDEFEQGSFPADGNDLPVLRSQAVSEAIRTASSADEAVRLETVVASWGGQPSTWEQALQLPAPLFRAFGLTPPDGAIDAPRESDGDPDGPGEEEESEQYEPDAAVPDPIESWVNEIEEWGSTSGHQLDQQVANALRKALAELVVQMLPRGWPGLPSLPVNDFRKLIYIHSALGNNRLTPDSAIVSLPVAKVPKARAKWKPFVSEMIALLRWHESTEKGLSYYGAKQSFPTLLSLADRVTGEAAKKLIARDGPSAAEDRLKYAASLLLLASQANEGNTAGSLGARLEDLFRTLSVDSLSAAMPDEVKSALRTLVAATGDGGGVRKFLLKHVGARQGSGPTSHAVDAAALLKLLSGLEPNIPGIAALNQVQAGLADELLPAFREAKTWHGESFSDEARAFVSWFGEDSPKKIRDEILGLAEQALERGLVVAEARAVVGHKERLDAGAARKLVSGLSALETWEPSTLATLSLVDWTSLKAWQDFTESADGFIETLERELEYRGVGGGGSVNKGILRAFEEQLDRVSETVGG